jgi:hypothetical protein
VGTGLAAGGLDFEVGGLDLTVVVGFFVLLDYVCLDCLGALVGGARGGVVGGVPCRVF